MSVKTCARFFLFFIMLLLSTGIFSQSLSSSTPIGYWKTVDDKTGLVLSIVQIYSDGQTLSGRISKIMPVAGQKPTDICQKCEGKLKNAPMQGMTIIWGMQQLSADTWGKGRVLNPKSGHVYHATMKLLNQGEQLRLRGYILMPALGRSETWMRAKK